MENFTPLSAAIGGALIGLAAAILMLANGRIAGVSGIVGGLVRPRAGEVDWRVAFVAGLILAPLLLRALGGEIPGAKAHEEALADGRRAGAARRGPPRGLWHP